MKDVSVLKVAVQQGHIRFRRRREFSREVTRSFQMRREVVCLVCRASRGLGSGRCDSTFHDVRQSREQPGRLFWDTDVMQAAHESRYVPDLIWAWAGNRLARFDAFE
jgi:hypothetical protein